ncbi:P-loop containing nucleoside triphosphate hydrolase protein [Chytridium lagenaria]|nr:P-loop containing nucleoside triphosphate hydrolase protein [Chytridium lagenaria]
MGKVRFNAKARSSVKGHTKKKPSKSEKSKRDDSGELDPMVSDNAPVSDEYRKSPFEMPMIIDKKEPNYEEDETPKDEASEVFDTSGFSSKKRKRMEKFVEKQLKKEERVKIIQKLSQDTFSSDLLQSSKSFSRKMTKKERLRRAFKEEKAGIQQSDPSVQLYVDHHIGTREVPKNVKRKTTPPTKNGPGFGAGLKAKAPQVDEDDYEVDDKGPTTNSPTTAATSNGFGAKSKSSLPGFGAGLKLSADSSTPAVFGAGLISKTAASETLAAEATSKRKKRTLASENTRESKKLKEQPKEEDLEKPVVTSTLDKGKKTKSAQLPAYQRRLLESKAAQLSSGGEAPKSAFFVPVNRTEAISLKRVELPVVGEEQQIMEAIYENDCVIICGETGSGKTTQVPQFLYEAGFGDSRHEKFKGIVGITQPRRVAAVSMANRVAEEMNLRGGEVAYQIRYDSSTVNTKTRIKFMTDGILLRELSGAVGASAAADKEATKDLLLSKYSCLIIDEAHERTIGTDILIGWLTRIVALRNSGRITGIGPLKLVIMSATLRVEDFTENGTLFSAVKKPPVVKVDGRQYKVVVHYNRITPEIDYVAEASRKCQKFIESYLQATAPDLEKGSNDKEKGGMSLFEEEEEGEEHWAQKEAGEDDFDAMETDDDEEDEVHVLAGQDGDKGDDENSEENDKDFISLGDTPLHILPLYSGLPTAAQLRVFQDPPPGTRLCIVATNVAETSITIPNIKYVVDCGKVKERFYESRTGVQNYQVRWTSQASADQRAGRAGRVGPGHCYRLFSSAVFSNYFETFSKPEIQRVPVEGVILQMKSMGISNVINFPFPTPPSADSLRKGERLLVHLGALTRSEAGEPSKITELGRLLSSYPISPRYAKMLVIAASQTKRIVEFLIAIVAGMTVGDIFIREESIHDKVGNEDDDDSEGSDDDEERRRKRSSWHKVMSSALTPSPHRNPAPMQKFCVEHFLRSKAMEEIARLRSQLSEIVQLAKIRHIMLAGFPDHIAKLEGVKQVNKTKKTVPFYSTMWTEKGQSFRIHTTSALSRRSTPAQWVMYEEIVKREERFNADNTKFTPNAADGNVTENFYLRNIMEQPEPRYVGKKDGMVAYCHPNYGPKMWELPMCEVPFTGGEAYVWFAKELLEGKPLLASKPLILTKSWARTQAKVLQLVSALPVVKYHHAKPSWQNGNNNQASFWMP